jgi:ATP-dependent Lon protease
VKDSLEIVPVQHVDEVLTRALVEPFQAIEWTEDDEHAAEPPAHAPTSDTGAAVRH